MNIFSSDRSGRPQKAAASLFANHKQHAIVEPYEIPVTGPLVGTALMQVFNNENRMVCIDRDYIKRTPQHNPEGNYLDYIRISSNING